MKTTTPDITKKRIRVELISEMETPARGKSLEEPIRYKHHAHVVIGPLSKTKADVEQVYEPRVGEESFVFKIDCTLHDTPEKFAEMVKKFGEYLSGQLLERVKLPESPGSTEETSSA